MRLLSALARLVSLLAPKAAKQPVDLVDHERHEAFWLDLESRSFPQLPDREFEYGFETRDWDWDSGWHDHLHSRICYSCMDDMWEDRESEREYAGRRCGVCLYDTTSCRNCQWDESEDRVRAARKDAYEDRNEAFEAHPDWMSSAEAEALASEAIYYWKTRDTIMAVPVSSEGSRCQPGLRFQRARRQLRFIAVAAYRL